MTGTGTAYPGDAVTGTPTYTATQGRTALAGAMGGATSARPLGGFSGVRPGTPTTIASATSTTWTVTPFGGYIDLETSGTNGGYFFSFQSSSTGSVTAAVGSARVDLLYVQISDSNTGDGSGLSPRAILDYQAGVGGAGIPTLTAPRAFVIAQINVPASGGGSPTVTWVAPSTVAAGGILPATASAVYPSSPYVGQYVDDLVGGLARWDGTGWRFLSPRVSVVPSSVTNGSTTAGGYVTAAGAPAVSLNAVFSSSFDAYEITFDVLTAAAATLNLTMRVGGTDAVTNYDTQRKTAVNGTDAAAQTLGVANWVASGGIGIAGARHVGKITLFDPAKAAGTFGKMESSITANPMTTSSGLFWGGLLHRTATAYDGITFAASTGNLTVNEIRVEGISRS